MAKPDVNETGTRYKYGERVRLEQRFRPEHDANGNIMMDKDGKEIHLWVLYYKHDIVDGKHPVIKETDGSPSKTTNTYIWNHVEGGVGTLEEMQKLAEQTVVAEEKRAAAAQSKTATKQ